MVDVQVDQLERRPARDLAQLEQASDGGFGWLQGWARGRLSGRLVRLGQFDAPLERILCADLRVDRRAREEPGLLVRRFRLKRFQFFPLVLEASLGAHPQSS